MELSAEVHDLLQRFRTLTKPHEVANQIDLTLKSASTSHDMQPPRMQDELLNVDDIYFDNDEYWLCGTPSASTGSVRNWLYEHHYDSKCTESYAQVDSCSDLSDISLSVKKVFDSRTYTRPKKKFIRPNIDKRMGDLMEYRRINQSTEGSNFNTPSKPLHFDLSQPMTCSRMFDNIAKNAPDNDSFQNMSPPSLINSMCSSTFTAAMDSSIIRNDPVLREIRIADYKSEPLMLQSLQSLTESYSSINSDSAENFVRRTLPQLLSAKTDSSECDENFYSLTGSQTMLDDKLNDGVTESLNVRNLEEYYYDTTKASYKNNIVNMKQLNATRNTSKRSTSTLNSSQSKSFSIDALTGDNKLDYETKTNRYSNEFLNSEGSNEFLSKNFANQFDFNNPSNEQSAHQSRKHVLDATFNKSEELACNATIIKSLSPKISNNSKSSPNWSIGNGILIRPKNSSVLSSNNANDTFNKSYHDTGDYYNSNEQVVNGTFWKDKDRSKTRVIDTSTLRNLACPKYGNGSGDSLDRFSNYSDSSKGSVGKMTMAEVDAIVERQEQSLLMSTPKPAKSMSRLFDPRIALPSPIHQPLQFSKEHLSDSELSEEYSTARASGKDKRLSMHFVNKTVNSPLNATTNLNRTYKSMSNLKQPSATGRSNGSLAVVKPTPSTANYATYRKSSATIAANSKGLSAIDSVTSYARSGSERNVPRAICVTAGTSQGRNSEVSNLHTIGNQLKASYSSLRPTFANLPHAPVTPATLDIGAVGQAALRSESAADIIATRMDQSSVRQLIPMKSASVQNVPGVNVNVTMTKQRGLSALPRPISGIPKPTTSKIPGPRSFRPSTTKPLTNFYYSNAMR